LSRSGVPSKGDARTRRRARGRGREREETLGKREGKRRNSRRREEKRESDEVEDEGRPSFFRLGVARVHLIYRTLRNAEGTTPKLNHYPSEAPALRPHVASRDAPALRPYELRRVPTTLRRFPMMLRRFSTMLRRIFMMLRRTEGLDRFRGLPSYARFGQSDRTQKRHGTSVPIYSGRQSLSFPRFCQLRILLRFSPNTTLVPSDSDFSLVPSCSHNPPLFSPLRTAPCAPSSTPARTPDQRRLYFR